jgi:hypothetical protein
MPDGRTFLIDADRNGGAPSPITLVLNWTAGLPANKDGLVARASEATVLAAGRTR